MGAQADQRPDEHRADQQCGDGATSGVRVGQHPASGDEGGGAPCVLEGELGAQVADACRAERHWGGRPRRTLLGAGALGGSVLGQEPADVQFFRTRAECLHELGALGVVFGEVVGEDGLRGDSLGPGAERGAQVE